jgi:UDP-N-acetylglucosamine 2-epimerase (non-hydrolysing)
MELWTLKNHKELKQHLKDLLSMISGIARRKVDERTMKRIKEFGLGVPEGVELIDPIGFLEFLQLEANAKLVLTDSGGVQEETCILKVPCVTLRDNTERPETLEVRSNALSGVNQNRILEGVNFMLSKRRDWKNPFGDGKAGGRISDTLKKCKRIDR